MSNERRTFFRCKVPNDDGSATLRIGQKEITVNVFEESVGGYTLSTRRQPPIKVGQTVRLATATGACEATVMHITNQVDEYRIGLRRLRELGQTGSFFSAVGASKDLLKFVAVFGICVVAYTWFASNSAGSSFMPSIGGLSGEKKSTSDGNADQGSHETRKQKLVFTYIQLDHLKTPTMAEQLRLTPTQRTQVDGILNETTRALNAIFAKRESVSADQWTQESLRIIQKSMNAIQSVLNEEQKQRWLQDSQASTD